MIDFKITTFLTVAKTKNFTRTADILHITQPAVSQHIKLLEHHYNVKLIYKNGRQMELTEEGKLLFNYALEMDRLSKMMESDIKNKSSIIKKYYIGATLTIGGYILPEIIGKHKSIYKNIDIMLYVENTESIMDKLFNGNISLGLVEGPFDRNKVKYTKLKDDELVLAVSKNHPFAQKCCVTIEDVLKERLILREKGSGTRKIFENALIKNGYCLENMNIYMEIGDITALISLVESNLGCTIISREAIRKSLMSGNLIEIPIKDFKILREFNFVYLEQHNLEFINNFIEFCKKNLELS
ncbi:HTH-type transcriptional regulator CysL [Clostridium tepidiprofundi DSM 19306]|uniref:HTH-type transcriptional regulator CysL n=1 Tax=Clostridium tepidiprofundi DSM 19306 TaxID=1121338 RepID=A0A151B274_9CLOT|nr:LysR family transcriptional regulator [Clostridium tepidiprofundi]KYH34021.1 HTH-type transcriptional regulator CysL [Clostridium tepidiprofundi DSM 19306]